MANDNKSIKIDSTIRNSLEFYDSNMEKYETFFNEITYIKSIPGLNINEMAFFDKNKKLLLQSPYEILGWYVPKQNIWKWSWSIPTLAKKHTFISRKILEYAFELNNDNEYMLKSKLINSKIDIYNDLQLDIHIALSSYIAKQPLIFKRNIVFLPDDNMYVESDEYGELYKLPKDEFINKNENYFIEYLFILNHEI